MAISEFNRQAQNPMSEYLLKLQLIVTNTEFKDGAEAKKYETTESLIQGDKYVSAVTGKDIFESYTYDSRKVYDYLLSKGYAEDKVFFLIQNPTMIPQQYKKELMTEAREQFLAEYEETNRYYLMLSGQPYPGSVDYPADEIVLIPDAFYEMYEGEGMISRDEPIHMMPKRYQELFMNTDMYAEVLAAHPKAPYLKYIGSNSIPIETSRTTRDGDILLINTNKLSTYHPVFGNVTVSYDIVHKFLSVYKETRDYVYQTLRGDFGDIYPNYNDFIRFLTIYLSIGNCLNEFLKQSGSFIHMNNVTANNLFTLYGLPSVIMEGTSMVEFLKKFRMLLMDKGTNIVYRVKDLIGYEYTDIYTLVMVKQQVFENGIPVYIRNKETGEMEPKSRIVFRRLGTTDENSSYFNFRESKTEYKYEEIRDADPRWWNTEETERMIHEMNYTLSNSKYIQLSTHLSMEDIWWECCILLRGLLDNQAESKGTQLNINYSINGSSSMSIFDAVLSLIILMNWELSSDQRHFMGDLLLPNGTYNGKDACLDMLCNGLYYAAKYIPGYSYALGQVLAVPKKIIISQTNYNNGKIEELSGEPDPNEKYIEVLVPADGKWYIATDDFVATDFDTDLANGKIREYCEFKNFDYDYPLNSPKELVPGHPFKIASFNFKLKSTPEGLAFYDSISAMEYVDPDVFLPMLDKVLERENINMGEVLMTDVKLIQQYLTTKLRNATRILDYRQISDIYANLFLVDPIRDWYSQGEFDVDSQLCTEYELSAEELYAFKQYFYGQHGTVVVYFGDRDHYVPLNAVLNKKVDTIQITSYDHGYNPYEEHPTSDTGNPETSYPFKDRAFIQAFDAVIDESTDIQNIETSNLSDKIKNNSQWKNIIKSKVAYDYGDVDGYPRTYEDLMLRNNSSLYQFLMDVKNNKSSDDVVTFLRALIKALESYTNSSLAGLEFKSLGLDNYFYILKEVISYFKSYMVEFTRDEFVYVFDGIFDNGGRPNMIKLIDEIAQGTANPIVHDSATLYDVSCAKVIAAFPDDNTGFMYDEALFRAKATYGNMLAAGYELWYDDGKRITRTAPNISTDTEIIANIVADENDPAAYKLIINTNNLDVIPPNYYGNTR
jgi:hypothetical protein